MKGKARPAQRWLPTQVFHGIDCSDPDPERWTEFGELADQRKAEALKHATPATKEKV